MCPCPSVPHAWCDSPAHSWMEMWELKAYDWSISGCCRAHLIFSCKNVVVKAWALKTWKQSSDIGLCLRNDTWALKTGTSWRDWGHHHCCYRQNEALFAPAGSDDKDALCPCAQNGDRCHWAWTVEKTMNKYNDKLWKLIFSVSREIKTMPKWKICNSSTNLSENIVPVWSGDEIFCSGYRLMWEGKLLYVAVVW